MDKNGTTAKWIIGILVSVLLFVGGYAAASVESRVVVLEEQSMEYATELSAINAKLDILLRHQGIAQLQ